MKMGKHLTIILKEMCERVGANFDDMKFLETNWFHKYAWTAAEEFKFKTWFVDYLYDNAEARREIMAFPRKNKKEIGKVANDFIFNYGWKQSD